MADKLSDYFYKAVVCSGYNSYPETININIPIRAYVGTVPAGEDPASVTFTTQTFSYIFGKENVFICNTYHGGVPEKTFLQDKNNNNRSDVIEWMLE